MVAPSRESVIQLYPYQQRFFADTSRVQLAIWCRQAGKDFATACKADDHAIRTGQDWFIVSKSQRQADATFAKCKRVASAFKEAFKLAGEIRAEDGEEYWEYDKEIEHSFRCQARTLHLPGGGSVTALPGRDPDTLAGLTGNVIFTEFGLFPKGGYDHWRVVFPLSTRGYQVVIISTPRGKNTKLFELYNQPEKYSVHFVDIYKAVAEGMPLANEDGQPITIEEFKDLYGDAVGWQREYLCKFMGDLEALVKWAQLVAAGEMGRDMPFDCLRVEGDSGWRSGFFKPLADIDGRAEMGWDVARRGDLSSLAVNISRPGHVQQLRFLVLMHNVSFALQRTIITEAMATKPTNVGCGDATGLGMDSNETLQTKYGDRWQPHTFTAKGKREIGSLLKTCFDDQAQIIPPTEGEHKFVATDIYAVQKEGDAEMLKLIESPNPLLEDSHCDVAYSLGLSRKAASIQFAQPYVSTHA